MQSKNVTINLLVHSFQRMHRILSVFAANPFVRMGEDGLFSELNRLYILSHTTFFELIESEDTELEGLKKVVYGAGFEEFDALERFIEMQELNLLTDYLRQNIGPIAAEISKLATVHRIAHNTYNGGLTTKTPEENLKIAGKSYEHLAAMDVRAADYAKENEKVEELQKVIWQQILDDQLGKLLDEYKKRVNEYSKKSFPEPEWLVFNQDNGQVFLNGLLLWKIQPGNREYDFFQVLFEHRGKALTHEEIAASLDIGSFNENTGEFTLTSISKTLSNYLSDLKSRLPKSVTAMIQSSKGKYLLNTKSVREK